MVKIFIIEKDKFFSSSLEAKFSYEGFEVKLPYDLSNNWFLIQEVKIYSPNFIILEPDLPFSYGQEILTGIKKENNLLNIPIVLFSEITGDYVDRLLNQGANYYFSKKNLNIDDFVSTINKIAKNKYKLNI
ncbi:response regulator [bacterium]|nr:response regulator [bacterium]